MKKRNYESVKISEHFYFIHEDTKVFLLVGNEWLGTFMKINITAFWLLVADYWKQYYSKNPISL